MQIFHTHSVKLNNSKLINSLFRLSIWELRKFQDFVHSPFHNKNKRVKALLAHLVKCYPDRAATALNKQTVFQAVYPKSQFDAQKVHNITSLLFRLYESYVAITHGQQQQSTRLNLLGYYAQQGMTEDFDRSYRKVQSQIVDAQTADRQDRSYLSYQAETISLGHLLKENRSPGPTLLRANTALDHFYYIAKLRLACEFLNRNKVIHQQDQPPELDRVVDELQHRADLLETNQTLSLYVQVFQMLKHPEEPAYFQRCMAILKQEPSSLSISERKEGTYYAINYCIRQINQGNATYLGILFNLYRWAFEYEILTSEGKLDEWQFKNVITIGLRVKAFEWVEQFIHEQKHLLPEEVQENAFKFNLASYCFAKKEYTQAKQLLLEVEFKDVFYNLDSRVLLAKIYVEQEDHEVLLNMLKSLNTYLHRNKVISANQKELYLNFSRFVQKLVALKEKRFTLKKAQWKSAVDTFKNEWQDTRRIAQATWVREQFPMVD